jgi:hypothetical protein
MTLNDVTQIGQERILAEPAAAGTTAIAASRDGNFFAIASKNGYVRLFSSRELAIRGITILKAKILTIRFLPGMLVCMLDNGFISIFLTEVRQPVNTVSFPADLKEIVPLYEANKNMGGLI